MPFQSQAQRRKFHAMESRGEISKATIDKWEKETGDRKLPEKKKKKKKAKKTYKSIDDLRKAAKEMDEYGKGEMNRYGEKG